VQWSVPDANAFASELKSAGAVQPCILEMVKDGGSFRVLLLNSMTMINFSLAGVQCPRVGSGKPPGLGAGAGAGAGAAAGAGGGGVGAAAGAGPAAGSWAGASAATAVAGAHAGDAAGEAGVSQ
jgi:hypothetical protein